MLCLCCNLEKNFKPLEVWKGGIYRLPRHLSVVNNTNLLVIGVVVRCGYIHAVFIDL